MKKINGLILGTLLATLFVFSGCETVDHWWKREHALKPLKEQYWNGELTWNEYRAKKEALIADLEVRGYQTRPEMDEALREQGADVHTENAQAAKKREEASDEVVLRQDEAMIRDTETEDFERKQAEEMATVQPAASTEPAIKPMQTAPVTSAPSASVRENVTDSNAVNWTRNPDGTVTYRDQNAVALPEQRVSPGTSPQAPALPQQPAAPSSTNSASPSQSSSQSAPVPPPAQSTPAAETPAQPEGDPAREQEEPVILDMSL